MFWLRKLDSLSSQGPRRRVSLFIDRAFQLKFGSMMVLAGVSGMALSLLPVHYFLRQNYAIFLDLAYSYAPELIHHLEREEIWVTVVLFSGFIGLGAFFVFLSLRMTSKVVAPIRVMRNHLRKLSRGHWYINSVKVREGDEFHDLIDTYNYFFESFRAQMIRDLDLLKKIRVDRTDPDSVRCWHLLVEERCLQLNLKRELPYSFLSVDSAAKNAGSHDSRRAS